MIYRVLSWLVEESKIGLRKQIRQRILKPAYYAVHHISPTLADEIHRRIFQIVTWMRLCVTKLKPLPPYLKNRRPGILVDVSNITKQDVGTGIQRVVNNIFWNMHDLDVRTFAVQDMGGFLITAEAYLQRRMKGRLIDKEKRVRFQTGDILFCLDSSWDLYQDFEKILLKASENHIKSYAIVHDLIPIQYPEIVSSPLLARVFTSWHNMMLARADGIICDSRTTADIVAHYYESNPFSRKRPLNLYYFHLGSDIIHATGTVREKLLDFVGRKRTFLMVGTVEPRKGHMAALEAMRSVLVSHDIQLLIMGRDGWKNGEIKSALEDSDLTDRVLWIQDASDDELHWAYQNTEALIAASKDEGFGLPLVEAAYFGLPILCSDIPIFREVTQGYADYFKVLDAASLATVWKSWLETDAHPDTHQIRLYTWKESAQEILDIFAGKIEPYKIL